MRYLISVSNPFYVLGKCSYYIKNRCTVTCTEQKLCCRRAFGCKSVRNTLLFRAEKFEYGKRKLSEYKNVTIHAVA